MALKSIEWIGGPITKPGVYSNMPLDRYHSRDVCDGVLVSSSALRKIALESPAHYWCQSPFNPDRIEDEPQRHFVLGRAMHHFILGEAHFAKIFRVAPPEVRKVDGTLVSWSLRTNEAKAWMDTERRRGIEVILPGEVKHIEGMAHALQAHPMVDAGAFDGYVERSIFWKDTGDRLMAQGAPGCDPNPFRRLRGSQNDDQCALASARAHHRRVWLCPAIRSHAGRLCRSRHAVCIGHADFSWKRIHRTAPAW